MTEKTEGMIRCNYCGTENTPENTVRHTIHFRDRKPGGKAFVNSRVGSYCKNKGCGGYDQMAHEG